MAEIKIQVKGYNVNAVVMNGYQEKKNIQLYALIVNLLIGINLPERRNNFLSSMTPAYVAMSSNSKV